MTFVIATLSTNGLAGILAEEYPEVQLFLARAQFFRVSIRGERLLMIMDVTFFALYCVSGTKLSVLSRSLYLFLIKKKPDGGVFIILILHIKKLKPKKTK